MVIRTSVFRFPVPYELVRLFGQVNIRRKSPGKPKDALTNGNEQDRLKTSYGKSLEGKSMPKESFQRPRLVRKGSGETAEDGPGAAQVKGKKR